MNIVDVGVLTDAVLGNQSPCGGAIKINDLEYNSVSAVLCWVTKNHRLTINQALFGALRRIKAHISFKTEASFSSVPMEQRLMCKYLTAEK